MTIPLEAILWKTIIWGVLNAGHKHDNLGFIQKLQRLQYQTATSWTPTPNEQEGQNEAPSRGRTSCKLLVASDWWLQRPLTSRRPGENGNFPSQMATSQVKWQLPKVYKCKSAQKKSWAPKEDWSLASLKLTASSHLDSFWDGLFSGAMLVSGSVSVNGLTLHFWFQKLSK